MTRRVRTTARKRPRQERSLATVDALLQATAHILVEEGYDQASTNRIAERAGVSIGSLYQYFPGKEALVGELVDRFSRRITEMVVERLSALADSPPEVVVRELVTAMVLVKREDPQLAQVLREQIPRVGRMQRYERQLETIVDAAEAYATRWRDRIAHDDLAMAAFITVHTVDAVTHGGVTRRPPLPDDALIEQTTRLVLGYLTGRLTPG